MPGDVVNVSFRAILTELDKAIYEEYENTNDEIAEDSEEIFEILH